MTMAGRIDTHHTITLDLTVISTTFSLRPALLSDLLDRFPDLGPRTVARSWLKTTDPERYDKIHRATKRYFMWNSSWIYKS